MSYDGLIDKLLLSIIFLSFSGIVFSSSYHADSELKFNAFAQTDPSTDPGASPIPDDNSTSDMLGDNSTDTANPGSMDTTSSDNSTSVPDVSSTDPSENDTMSTSDMSGQQETLYPSTNDAMSSNMAMNQHGVLPPLQQLKSGVLAKDVQCTQGFTLILKIEDGSPACVDTQVSQILTQRGW
ncbi:MAG: hypothetical protein KGI28_01315 [Thaumarchaeota archaeon]|nr:hypothetical protein [Nitrososphaerota archaeon]